MAKKIRQLQVENLVEDLSIIGDKLVKSISVTGTTQKKLTITFEDDSFIVAEFTDLNTEYQKMTLALLEAGVDVVDRVVSAKVIADYVNSKVETLFKWKTSVTDFSDLPTTGNSVGDVYNIENEFAYEGKAYPAGSNVVWQGTKWDILHGFIDTSQFLTEEEDPKGVKSIEITGTTTKTITITLRDDTKVTGTFADLNTTYATGTKAQIDAGTDTTGRLWSSKTLFDFVTGLIDGVRIEVHQDSFTVASGNVTATNATLTLSQSGVDVSKVSVFMNGIKQPVGSYNINASNIVITQASIPTPIIAGDWVEVYYLD